MEYSNFINYVEMGHEFFGYVEGKEFKLINVSDDNLVVLIGKDYSKVVPYDNVEEFLVYNNKTFKEMFEDNIIELVDMY